MNIVVALDDSAVIKKADGPEVLDARSVATTSKAYVSESCDVDKLCFLGSTIYSLKATATLEDCSKPTDKYKCTPVPTILPAAIHLQVRAPDPDKIMWIRFDREAFVTNVTSISFVNGMLSDFKSTDPSEFVGFLSLPKDLLASVTLTVPLVK